jgi:hypothetical protein
MSMNFLAPETSHIMALKIKDYIISSLLLARWSNLANISPTRAGSYCQRTSCRKCKMQKFQFFTASPLRMRACSTGRKFAEYNQRVAHHYLRLIVDDHTSYSGPGLSGRVAHSRRVRLNLRLGILWLIVADHDCIYWLYLYSPDLLYPYLLLYYTLYTLPYPTLPYPTLPYPTLPYPTLPYPTRHESCHFQASVNAWASVLLYFQKPSFAVSY